MVNHPNVILIGLNHISNCSGAIGATAPILAVQFIVMYWVFPVCIYIAHLLVTWCSFTSFLLQICVAGSLGQFHLVFFWHSCNEVGTLATFHVQNSLPLLPLLGGHRDFPCHLISTSITHCVSPPPKCSQNRCHRDNHNARMKYPLSQTVINWLLNG